MIRLTKFQWTQYSINKWCKTRRKYERKKMWDASSRIGRFLSRHTLDRPINRSGRIGMRMHSFNSLLYHMLWYNLWSHFISFHNAVNPKPLADYIFLFIQYSHEVKSIVDRSPIYSNGVVGISSRFDSFIFNVILRSAFDGAYLSNMMNQWMHKTNFINK